MKLFPRNNIAPRHIRRTRLMGFTMLESFIAIAAFSSAAVFSVVVLVMAGKNTKASVEALPASMNNFRLMEKVRYEILPARAGSFQVLSDTELMYYDSSNSRYSKLYFNGNGKAKGLWLIADLGDPSNAADDTEPIPVGRSEKMVGCKFVPDNFGQRVKVTIQHSSKKSDLGGTSLTYTEWLTARN